MANIARVRVSQEVLLRFLDFNGGHIRSISQSEYYPSLVLVIEHPDMPLVREGEMIPDIMPEYTTSQTDNHIRTDRIFPPKIK